MNPVMSDLLASAGASTMAKDNVVVAEHITQTNVTTRKLTVARLIAATIAICESAMFDSRRSCARTVRVEMLPRLAPAGPESVGARRPGPAKAWLSWLGGGVGNLWPYTIRMFMQWHHPASAHVSKRD